MSVRGIDAVHGTPANRLLLALAAAWISMMPACAMAGMVGDGGLPAGDEIVHIDSELTVRRIAPDSYVVIHEPAYASNILLVRMPDGTLVICSSPLDTQATRIMLRWIDRALAPKRIVAFNTHYHPDGTAGNEAYTEAGVDTYATGLTQRLLADHGARVLDASAASVGNEALAARMRGTRIIPASHTIPESAPFMLAFGGEEVRVIQPGPAHSPDNIVVHFPARGILFGGCMVKAGSSIGYLGDADLGNWEAAAHSLEWLKPLVVIPGHGAVGGAELLLNTIEVVRAARKAALHRTIPRDRPGPVRPGMMPEIETV